MVRVKFDKTTSSNEVIFFALNEFFGEINKLNGELRSKLRRRIPESVGLIGTGVLTSAIPNLRFILADDDDADNENEMEDTTVSHQRWKILLCRLMKCISDRSHPVAILFDGEITCVVCLSLVAALFHL